MKTKLVMLAAGVVALASAAAQTSTAITDLSSPIGSGYSMSADGGGLWLAPAVEFVTGGSDVSVVSATVVVDPIFSGATFQNDPTGTYSAFLYSDSNDVPDIALYSLGSQGNILSQKTQLTFSGAGNITLTANTKYWLALAGGGPNYNDAASAESGTWRFTDSPVVDGLPDWNMFWGVKYVGSSAHAGSFALFSIEVSPVPEPTTLALAGLAAALLAVRRKKAG